MMRRKVNRVVRRVSRDEVMTTMKKMKNGEAVDADDIPAEAWRCLGRMVVEL